MRACPALAVAALLASSLQDTASESFASLRSNVRPDAPNRSPVRCESECSDAFSPVCGTNGKTYTNFCYYGVAACKNKTLAVAYTAACIDEPEKDDTDATPIPTETAQPSTKAPSTESPNKFDAQPLLKSDEGFAAPASIASPDKDTSCEMYCFRNYDPVCGSDGITYANLCRFDEANCKARGRLEVVSQSACRTPSPTKAAA